MENISEETDPGDIALPGLCGERGSRDLFWSYSLTLNTSNPDLTVCFQRSVLLWLPCGWLWLASIFYLIYLYSLPRKHGLWHFSHLNFIKTISSCILCVLTLVDLCLVLTSVEDIVLVDSIYYTVRLLSMFLVLVLTRWEYLLGLHTSGVLSIFWLLQLVADIFILRSWSIRMHEAATLDDTQFIIYCFYFVFCVVSFLTQLWADRQAMQGDKQSKTSESVPLLTKDKSPSYECLSPKAMPSLTAPFWKIITFLWITMDIIRGNLSLVTFDKLYEIRPFDTCSQLLPKFYSVYDGEQSQSKQPGPGEESRQLNKPFLWSLMSATMSSLLVGGVLCLIAMAFRVFQAIMLGWLISWIESRSSYTWQGVVLAFGLLFLSLISSLFLHNFLICNWLAGLRARSVANAVIYRKALRLSASAKKQTTVGEILNLMSVDAQKLQDMCVYGNLVWEVPLEVIVNVSVIWTVIGPSALSGLGVLIFLTVVNGFYVADWTRKLQAKQMVAKDERVKSLNEVLAGMKIIKLYAWEPSFLSRITDTRSLEIYYLRVIHLLSAISNTFWFLVPFLVSLAVFATFVLSSPLNVLDPRTAFVTMALINVMNFTCSILPMGVTFFGQGIVSIRRISRFLEMEELEEGVVERDISMAESISFDKASFSWERDGRAVLQE